MKTQHQPSEWEAEFEHSFGLDHLIKTFSDHDDYLMVRDFIRHVESSALERGMAHELADEELENSAYFKARIKMARDEGRDEGSKGDYGRKMFQGGYREGLQAALEVLPNEYEIIDEDTDVGWNAALSQSKEAILKLLDL